MESRAGHGGMAKFSCLNKSSVAQEMRKEAAEAGETVSAVQESKKEGRDLALIFRKTLFELHQPPF